MLRPGGLSRPGEREAPEQFRGPCAECERGALVFLPEPIPPGSFLSHTFSTSGSAPIVEPALKIGQG